MCFCKQAKMSQTEGIKIQIDGGDSDVDQLSTVLSSIQLGIRESEAAVERGRINAGSPEFLTCNLLKMSVVWRRS
jgi:hypothetical protein